ncbi:MAG: tetratricopeptide repeat protein [Nitrospirota bacterium]
MWSRIIVAGTILLSMTACGSSRSLPATQDKLPQIAKQGPTLSSPIQQLHKQAEKGDAEAQFNLGLLYDHGGGVPKDKREALRWYRLAASQGDTFAQNALGDNYWEGTGVLKDDREAVRWWRLAADKGFAPAQHSLGKLLSGGGQGVPSDKVQAYMWLVLSAAQGDEEAGLQGDILSKQLKPADVTNVRKLVKQWKPSRASATVNKIAQ